MTTRRTPPAPPATTHPPNRDLPTARGATSSQELARAGWGSGLAAYMTTCLLLQGVTGLWLYLAPFSVAAQAQLLLHLGIGVLTLIPLIVYLVRHLATWWRQRATASMILGYALLAAVATCVVSGLVLTWQAATGPRMQPAWDLVHLVSGVAATLLLGIHLALALVRRRHALQTDAAFRVAVGTFARRAGITACGAAAVVIAICVIAPEPPGEFDPPPGYELPASVEDDYEEYRDSPFAPSNARTASLRLVEPGLLAGSASCGSTGCHEEILAEWEPSAHRFAAMNPPFQAVQRNFADDREPAETRYCAGCHDPVSLFAGAKDIAHQDLSAPGMQEGISCVGCHSISAADTRGNADYVLTPPRKYIGENGTGAAKWIADFLIRAYPRQHLDDYDRNLLRTPEFCAACHKQFIPESLNEFGIVPGQNQYDEWLSGHWHTEDPETDLSCADCHMRLVDNSTDPGHGEAGDARRSHDDGKHRHHGFIATNAFMPEVLKLPHWERQVELTEEWIRGETVLPEIDHVWPRGPVATIEFAGVPKSAKVGQDVELRVVVANRKAGHNFITGPLDFVRSWVHLTVKDAGGAVIAEWGDIDPRTRRINDRSGEPHRADSDPSAGTLVLEANPVDADGNLLEQHELWRKAGGKGKRVVFPRYSDAQIYRFAIPADARGPLSLHAELNFRRYRQKFLELVVPAMESGSGVQQRTVTQSSVTHEIRLEPGDQ